MSGLVWVPKLRTYDTDKSKMKVALSEATTHPLLANKPKPAVVEKPVAATSTTSSSRTSTKSIKVAVSTDDGLDPLSAFASDPLSRAAVSPVPVSSSVIDDPLSANSNPLESKSVSLPTSNTSNKTSKDQDRPSKYAWRERKAQIKRDFAVTGNIQVADLNWNEEGNGVEDGSSTRKVDKYDRRLATLEQKQLKSTHNIEISQQEYESHVRKLSTDLDRAWSRDERVESLKIAIQLGKSMNNTAVTQFYPSLFVIVTDVLNHFGDLVYTRLLSKAEETLGQSQKKKNFKLPENFSSEDIPAIAKDTCRNWLYKTACIRELLPRIYVEISLLRCYKFLTDTDYPVILNRIGSMIRGLGDPLIANYARMYLVIVGNEVYPEYTAHALAMCQDIFFTFSALKDSYQNIEQRERNLPASMKTEFNRYLYLFTPVFEWILKCVGRYASKETFQSILQLYRDHVNDSMVLYYIIQGFEAIHYTHATVGMVTLIKSAEFSCTSIVELFGALGKQLVAYPPPEDQRIHILNEIWKIVSKSNDLIQFVRCTTSWLELIQKAYSERELLVLLGSLSNRLSTAFANAIGSGNATNNNSSSSSSSTNNTANLEQALEPVMKELENMITSLLSSPTYSSIILSSEYLLKLLDIFKGAQKVQLSKDILESYYRMQQNKTTSDPVLINTLFDLARIVHDSVDGLSAINDVAYTSTLLCRLIDLIDFGRDLEQQLTFYVDCRAAFPNLQLVKDKLIVSVNALSMKAYRYVKGKHTKKTTTFVKACLAYSHITIPSLADIYRKLELSLQSAEIALYNQCLPQTDTFLKSAISLLPELPTTYEHEGKRVPYDDKLVEYVNRLLAFLVLTPGHPEYGPFYIVNGLLNAIPRYNWTNSANLVKVYLSVLVYLSTMTQKTLPYHFPNVQSNDELYGNSKEYMKELYELINNIVTPEILTLLTKLGAASAAGEGDAHSQLQNKLAQCRLSLDFANILLSSMKLTTAATGQNDNSNANIEFIQKLIELSNKNKNSLTKNDLRYLTITVEYATKVFKEYQPKK